MARVRHTQRELAELRAERARVDEAQREARRCVKCDEHVMWLYGGRITLTIAWHGLQLEVVSTRPIHQTCMEEMGLVTSHEPALAAVEQGGGE